MKSNNKTLQGLKKVNDRLLGIETFLLALITILLVAAIFIEVFAGISCLSLPRGRKSSPAISSSG